MNPQRVNTNAIHKSHEGMYIQYNVAYSHNSVSNHNHYNMPDCQEVMTCSMSTCSQYTPHFTKGSVETLLGGTYRQYIVAEVAQQPTTTLHRLHDS